MEKYIDYYDFLDLMYRSDCSTREKIEEIADRCTVTDADILYSMAEDRYKQVGSRYKLEFGR